MAENIQGIIYPPVGRCIYCGSDGGLDSLRDEHIMPFALGGRAILPNASCSTCEAETSYIDGYLARAVFGTLRFATRSKSRRKQPKTRPISIVTDETVSIQEFEPETYPVITHVPVWDAPGIIRGVQPSPDFGEAISHIFWGIPEALQEAAKQEGGPTGIQDTTPVPNLATFARGIAKIAYCHGVAKYGLTGFRPLHLPALIIGRYENIPYLVGSDLGETDPPLKRGHMHTLQHSEFQSGRLRLLMCSVRLLAHTGTANNGMPTYHVVLGASRVKH